MRKRSRARNVGCQSGVLATLTGNKDNAQGFDNSK